MNNTDTDFNCITSSPIDYTTFPSPTARHTFNLNSFVAQLTALDEFTLDEPVVLYDPPFPSTKEVSSAERDVFSTLGDARFTGIAAYDFLHTRYKVLDVTDSMSSEGSSLLMASACDSEGFPYTLYIPNSANYYDSAKNVITLPVFDQYGKIVNFPLKDHYGKFLLKEALTAFDNTNELIYFPLKDIKNVKVTFPFKGSTGDIIITPPRNQEQLLNVQQAYNDLDTAYENSKNAHAFDFAQYVYNLEINNRIGFFYSSVAVPAQTAVMSYFAAGVFALSSSDAELIDITSNNLEFIIRYYPDKAQESYNFYTNIGGTGPYTIISPTTSTAIKDLILSENIKNASYNILSAPFWSPSTPIDQYYKNVVSNSTVHTSVLELYTKSIDADIQIVSLQSTVNQLTAAVSFLNTQLTALSAKYEATDTKVTYNSAIIDTLAVPITWQTIWLSPVNPAFIAPLVPAAR